MSGPNIAASATWSPDLAASWSAVPASAGDAKVVCVSSPVVPTAALSGFLRHAPAEMSMAINAEHTATRTTGILLNPDKCDMFLPPTPLSVNVELSRTLTPPAAVESTEPATAMEPAEAVEPAEPTRAHAAPAAGAIGSGRPAANVPTMRAQTAKRVRPSSPVVVLRPGVGVREMVVAEGAGSIDVDGISTHVAVELVSAHVSVELVAVVIAVRVIPAVVAIGMVPSGVATVPSRIAVEGGVVVQHCAAGPIASPRRPSPSATSERTNRHSGAERERTRKGDISRCVAGRHVRVAVNDSGVVLRNVDDLRVGRFNDNRLRALLHDRHLRRRFQVPASLRLRTQGLNRGHHRTLLGVVRLSQL